MTFIQDIEHFSVYCLGLFVKHKNIEINLGCPNASIVDFPAKFADFGNSNAKKISQGDKQTFIENFKAVIRMDG